MSRASRALGGIGDALWRRPRLGLASLLAPPLAWLCIAYLGALAVLILSAFWSLDPISSEISHAFTLDNFEALAAGTTYRTITLRTVGLAALVSLTDMTIAFPFAYYMARIAGPRLRLTLFILVLLPLWSSYLARVYSWRLILAHDGVLNWALQAVGLPTVDVGYSIGVVWLVFSYVWLPFMVAPLYATLERIPDAMWEASSDLGARGFRTLTRVTLPLALPGLAAGSIFTFSLTLGDYITPILVGGPGSDLIGNVVYSNVGVANDIPFAAAFACVPLAIMGLYLAGVARLGAFDAL